nr:Bm1392 [Brugia malayi]
MTITSFIYAIFNISYTLAILIVCVKKRNVKTVKDKSEQHKLLPQQSKKLEVRKQPFGPAPLPKGAMSKGSITAVGASNKQTLQQTPITANQMKQIKNDKDIQSTQLSKEQIGNAKNGKKNLLQRIKDIKEKKDGQVQYEQYKSIKRRKKGKKLEIAKTQRSTRMKEQLKKEDQMKNEEQEEEEEDDDTMKGIASLQQDLNIVSTEE